MALSPGHQRGERGITGRRGPVDARTHVEAGGKRAIRSPAVGLGARAIP